MSDEKDKKVDQALVFGEKDGEAKIVRFREGGGTKTIEVGTAKSVEDMTPEEMSGKEIINLKKREGSPFSDVEVVREGTGHQGPARVVSQAYRDNWDDVFGNDEVPENVTWN